MAQFIIPVEISMLGYLNETAPAGLDKAPAGLDKAPADLDKTDVRSYSSLTQCRSLKHAALTKLFSERLFATCLPP